MYRPTWDARQSNIQQTFKQIALDILRQGFVSKPRGKETKQRIGATVIMNPNDTMIRNKTRKMNYVFSLIEKLVYTSGNGMYSGILDWYNSNYSYYQDGLDIGNYCWRIAPQIRRTVELLTKDPDSRQAIISIYNSLYDQRQTKDVPCTLALQFLIRNKKLDMIVTMRSNDLLWGFSYDINQFAYIQKLIAMFLGCQVGNYIHHSNSLHIYEYSYAQFQKITSCDQYFTEEQQPDMCPSYATINKVTSYFQDAQKFWRYQSRLRFYPQNFDNIDVSFMEEGNFFQSRLTKICKYNEKKDPRFLAKYFKTIIL